MRWLCFYLFFTSITCTAISQTKSPAIYQSFDDAALTIKKVFVAPFYDNQNSVYAPTMTAHIKSKISEENQWEVQPVEETNKSFKISDQLDSNSSERISLMKRMNVQALITSKIIKGPKGLSLRMTIYTGEQAQALIQENIDQIKNFETEEIKKNYDLLWNRMKKHMPYNGVLLSRRGSDVTINLGTKNGLTPKAEVRAILILKLVRHPKLQYMTSAEKEILGKIEITKLDDYLSFGTITYEKEPNLLSAGMKIQMDEMTLSGSSKSSEGPVDKMAFGEKPKEWVPLNPPQYGLLGISLGMNQYNQSANLTTVGNLSAVNNFAPTLKLNGEFWLNEDWYLALSLRQSALAISNGLSGSSPEKLNMSLSQQLISLGYNLLVTDQFFGPKFQFTIGLSQFHAQVDPSSRTAFTTMNYGGLALGFSGSFPVSEEKLWDLGAQFKYFMSPTTSESGSSSGSVTSTKINDFGIFTRYHRSQNFNYLAELGFEYYATDFNPAAATRPDPATSISHKVTNILLGIEYLF